MTGIPDFRQVTGSRGGEAALARTCSRLTPCTRGNEFTDGRVGTSLRIKGQYVLYGLDGLNEFNHELSTQDKERRGAAKDLRAFCAFRGDRLFPTTPFGGTPSA